MHLIMGLGNPGAEYDHTRHNVGFLAIDTILQSFQLPELKPKREFQGAFCKGTVSNHDSIILKPLTYMNLSGQSVSKVSQYFKVDPEDIIVLYDELDLPLGKIRIQQGGSAAGHNGIKSLMGYISPDFIRIRIGIGKSLQKEQSGASYVLSKFSKREQEVVNEVLADIPDVIQILLEEGVEKAQNRFN